MIRMPKVGGLQVQDFPVLQSDFKASLGNLNETLSQKYSGKKGLWM